MKLASGQSRQMVVLTANAKEKVKCQSQLRVLWRVTMDITWLAQKALRVLTKNVGVILQNHTVQVGSFID